MGLIRPSTKIWNLKNINRSGLKKSEKEICTKSAVQGKKDTKTPTNTK
jgi:hypothetical protein